MIKSCNDLRITKRVHLRYDHSRHSFLRVLCLSLDQLQESILHPDWCHNQTVPVLRLRISGKHVKHCSCILAEALITGKNAAVRIKLCSRVVIVTSCQMDITADSGVLTANHQSNLTVCFQANQTINNMTACFFQHFCPHNIMFLIKTCLQLYQNRNLFTILRCLGKCCNDRGISADTVQRLLNRQHIRILCRLAYKIYNRVKAHIWMV